MRELAITLLQGSPPQKRRPTRKTYLFGGFVFWCVDFFFGALGFFCLFGGCLCGVLFVVWSLFILQNRGFSWCVVVVLLAWGSGL